jgi:leader peptidase (prepilin peptidase)/N-methyltransferase
MDLLFRFYALIFGLLIGSFLNVVILRLPKNLNIVSDRSQCPKCKRQLKWYHNIPVFSFIFLKGKCGFCYEKISWRYPLVELLTGLISWWLFPLSLNAYSFGLYLMHFAIACIFICHFFIDLDHQLLLDKLNIFLLALVLPFSLMTYNWYFWVLGGLLGFGIPLVVTWLFYKLRGQIGMGGGDIKLFGIVGLYLGPTGVFFTIFLSCLVGAVLGSLLILLKLLDKNRPIAFGPFIILVASFQIFFPDISHIVQEWFF